MSAVPTDSLDPILTERVQDVVNSSLFNFIIQLVYLLWRAALITLSQAMSLITSGLIYICKYVLR
jgi:hypothetical protein